MSYNTGNPVPSRDPRDLVDNAENLDRAVNGDESTWTDRLGRERKSWRGMENDFSDFLANSGYQLIGDYAPGIEITAYNQIVRDGDGEFWRLSGQTELPYVTTGAGLPEGGAFVAVGDAALRQELASPSGAAMVGRGAMTVGSISDLVELPEELRKADLSYYVIGYHTGSALLANPENAGGGRFIWDASRSQSDHNGITVIDPDKAFPADWSIAADVEDWFTASNAGNGCFVRVFDGALYASWAGLIGDGVADETAATQALFSLAYSDGQPREVIFPGGRYRMTGSVGIPQLQFNSEYTNRLSGCGDAVIVLSDMPANTPWLTSLERKNNPSSTEDLYTGNLRVSGLSFTGDRTKSVAIDGDAIYNAEFVDCNFRNIFKCFSSGYTKGIYPNGYFQSLFVHHCRFTNCGNGTDGGIIYGSMGFNVTFNDNFCEAGNRGYGVHLFGGASQALRIERNVYEGGGRFVQLTNSQGVISGNYLEANLNGVNTQEDSTEIRINDTSSSAVASTLEISNNVFFPTNGENAKLINYTGIQENNLTITGNQVRHPSAKVYYSTNSRPGLYKNNSNHINLVTDPDTGNRAYTIEGMGYRKTFNRSLPAAGVRNLIFAIKGAGELVIKITAVLSGRVGGATVEYRVIGASLSTTSDFKVVEVLRSDDNPGILAIGSAVTGVGTLTIPVTTGWSNGGRVFVSVSGVIHDEGVTSAGMTAADPDVCKITLVTP